MRSILLVDANREAREVLAVALRQKIGCVILEAQSIEEAVALLKKQEVCLVITDLFAPQRQGLDLLRQVQKLNPETAIIVCVPHQDRESLVEALKSGAIFTIQTPYDLDEAVIATARGLEHHDLLVHRDRRSPKVRKSDGFFGIVGDSPKMKKLFSLIEKVADDDVSTVLIHGESGTGKELVARAIHAYSARQGKNFVPVNCAAIPEELLESELFGYVKGAFTGANQSKVGRIQYADGGVLFLDEIGDMQPNLQTKLLRVLQEREFEPVGSVKPVSVNVRVLAATHRDLEEMVAAGRFREDLYYRLNVVPLSIPPLRERQGDIAVLIDKFIRVFNRGKKVPFKGFTAAAMAALLNHSWPGNVRELENLIQRMVILYSGDAADVPDLPEKYQPAAGASSSAVPVAPATAEPAVAATAQSGPPGYDLAAALAGGDVDFNALVSQFEDQLILGALAQTGGNKKEAAQLLNLKRTTLIEKIKKKQL